MAREKMTDEQKRVRQKEKTVKANQVGVCRFVDIVAQLFEPDGNGGWKHIGSELLHGLQYENKVLTTDGRIKLVNAKGVRIVATYETIPTWATPYMRDLHMDNFFFNKPIVFQSGGVNYV